MSTMNYKEIVTALRAAKSKSYRGLFGAAADTIEALVDDLKRATSCDPCLPCAHYHQPLPCEGSDFVCKDCPQGCHCKGCIHGENFEWRGVQKGGH